MDIKKFEDIEDYIKGVEAILENIESDMQYQSNVTERIRYEAEESKAICGRIGTEIKSINRTIESVEKSIYEIIQVKIHAMQSDIEKMKATQDALMQLLKDIQARLWDTPKLQENGKTAKK